MDDEDKDVIKIIFYIFIGIAVVALVFYFVIRAYTNSEWWWAGVWIWGGSTSVVSLFFLTLILKWTIQKDSPDKRNSTGYRVLMDHGMLLGGILGFGALAWSGFFQGSVLMDIEKAKTSAETLQQKEVNNLRDELNKLKEGELKKLPVGKK